MTEIVSGNELLNQNQIHRAVEVMRSWLGAPSNPDGRTPYAIEKQLDDDRIQLIDTELGPLVREYLTGKKSLTEFKSQVDGINKRNEYWGFKGIKGQMFFNMVVRAADDDLDECDSELKAAICVPDSEDIAKSRIKTFTSYVRRLGEQLVEAGETKHKCPRISSIPFFLSYFWQIQDRTTWPVYYTSSINTMSDLNLWQSTDDLANDYIRFKHIHELLGREFTSASGKEFDLYKVEHVFWFKGGNPSGGAKPIKPPTINNGTDCKENGSRAVESFSELPDSYIPPVISILPRMALHEDSLIEAAKKSGISLERAFEKNVHAAFTILGYKTTLLGQGQGRTQDGLAIDYDNYYAVLWDSKVRKDGYSMGTDDRTIREYITTQSRGLKKRGALRNIYYAVVSSSFKDDFDDTIRGIKMETDVSEVCLIEAEALVAMIDLKLRDPQQVTLGPDGVQRIFSNSGSINANDVRNVLG
ncbi:MAG: hypothetical protein MPJ24_04985 [Pirellulaceae bacterium]|nr:hypothetical protein [Pirellulaceae bacterium]